MRMSLIAQAPRREKRMTRATSERWNRGNAFGSVQGQLYPLQSRFDVDNKRGLDVLGALFRVRRNFPQPGHDALKRDCFAASPDKVTLSAPGLLASSAVLAAALASAAAFSAAALASIAAVSAARTVS